MNPEKLLMNVCVNENLDTELEKLLSQPDLKLLKNNIKGNQRKQFDFLDTVLSMYETELYDIMNKYQLDYDELAKKILD